MPRLARRTQWASGEVFGAAERRVIFVCAIMLARLQPLPTVRMRARRAWRVSIECRIHRRRTACSPPQWRDEKARPRVATSARIVLATESRS